MFFSTELHVIIPQMLHPIYLYAFCERETLSNAIEVMPLYSRGHRVVNFVLALIVSST